MDQVYVVRHKALVEGQSIRSIAREMGVGRNTIRKYLQVSEPIRVERNSKPAPVTETVGPRIEQILEEWKPRTTPKQRVTGTRVHRQLVEEGYEVGDHHRTRLPSREAPQVRRGVHPVGP